MPINQRRKSCRHMTAQPRLVPAAVMPFPDFSRRVVTVFETHPRDGDSLLIELPVIRADEEIEVLPALIKDHRKIAVASCEIKILGVAVERTGRRFEDDAEVLPGHPLIARDERADARRRDARVSAQTGRLVVIPAI